ncbi:hypothetical protein [Haloterrigena sp. H1]|nr:hypothetical protein [Haloterrigena sp. H1]
MLPAHVAPFEDGHQHRLEPSADDAHGVGSLGVAGAARLLPNDPF